MSQRLSIWMIVLSAFLLLTMSTLDAAEFSPTLEFQLAQSGSKDFVSAIIILQSPIDIRALDDQLHHRKATKAERHKEVIEALWYNADMTQPAFRVELDQAKQQGELEGYTAYWIENLFVLHATKDMLESLRTRGDIKYVCENFRAEPIEPIRAPRKEGFDEERERNPLDQLTLPPGITAIGAYQVNTQLGITGQGVLVGNCDTGVDGNHPALSARWRGNFAPWYHCWRDALGTNTQFPNDGNSHGTHVMGTITGRAIVGADTQWIGCAPNARWMATNSINQGVSQNFDNDIIADYQWFAEPDSNQNTTEDVPDVVQNSWGVFTGLGYAQCFDYWNTVVQNCEAGGTVITWSAGNESTSGLRSPAIYELNSTQIFSVGAVDATNFGAPYPLAGFSSQGPTPCQPNPGAIKPEISAPGVNVYSSVPGGGYSSGFSGTSMAGPHVAGCVALMREACPNCDPTTIKNAIMNAAIDVGYGPAGPDNQFGAGFIDCYQAVLAVSNLGHLIGTVRDAGNNPLQGALVQNVNGLQQATTAADGTYDLPLQEGTYSIAYSKFGYVTQQVNDLAIIEGQNTTQDVNLASAPQGTVSGTVTDCEGGPAVGASVTVLNTPVPPAITNGTGFYSITLPQGTYDMRASGAGCGQHTVTGVVVGANATQDFILPADPRYLCSAADGGGYIACEDGDAGGPTFGWLEISPAGGGPGTPTNVTGDDVTGSRTLPFTYRHYGANYTSFYFSSNGVITFNSANSSWTNQSIPNATMGPAIFPFWDDLRSDNGGDISTYYFAAESAYIIEWNNIPHYANLQERETFQVWLCDVNASPSPNGDSRIRIQYQDVTNAASNTVGTQSGAIGNSYAYNNTLDPNAQGLVDSRAITYGGSGCVGDADISVTPTSVTGSAPAGGTDQEVIEICNLGPCPLNWSADFSQISPAAALSSDVHRAEEVVLTQEEIDYIAAVNRGEKPAPIDEPRPGADQLDDSGGPDAFGYYWIDSNEPGGPAFSWVDITGIGTNTGLAGDDQVLSFGLPWTFEFYGIGYNSVNVSSNGNVHFGASNNAFFNQPLPYAPGPLAMIAAFWDDLYLPGGGSVYYYDDAANNRFIIEWHQIDHFSNTGDSYTFEIILHSNGRILFQYLSMSTAPVGVTSATVGLQDAAAAVALQIVYDAAYLEDNLAIELQATLPWLSFGSPTSGMLNEGECADLVLNFDAAELGAGSYEGEIVFTSNDPDEDPLVVPVTFNVGALEAPDSLTIIYNRSTNQLEFRWTPSTGAAEYRLMSSTTPDGPYNTLEGTTAGTQLNLPFMAGVAKKFYVVVASDGNGANPLPSPFDSPATVK